MLKTILKRTLQLLILAFIVIQFFRPEKNKAADIGNNDISLVYTVPAEVQQVLKTSCYDCHSNNTVYPWYAEIQPVAWWLNDHIKHGKDELNFSAFKSYSIRRQYRKLEEINDLVKKDEMPLDSYLLIHNDARLTPEQKLTLATWVESTREFIRLNYPPDSLIRIK